MAHATQTMAGGDLSVRVPDSKLEELDALGGSFNTMATKLKKSFDDLLGEISTRKSREQELKESETRLRLSEERLKLAIDAASLGIWDWDIEQDRLVWDDSMYRLYGVPKEEFSGAFEAWSKCVVPEDVAQARADVETALRGESDYFSDFRMKRADGAIRIIRGVAQIIRNADGKPVRMVGINRDVTDLVNAEHERVRANEAVQAAQAELAQVARMTTMGELAASIAHEISQPLAAVVSYGNGALRWLAQAPPNLEETKAALKGVVEAGSHAGEVFVRESTPKGHLFRATRRDVGSSGCFGGRWRAHVSNGVSIFAGHERLENFHRRDREIDWHSIRQPGRKPSPRTAHSL